MTELKKSLEILKARWPEVSLIASLQILWVVLNSWWRTSKIPRSNIESVFFMGLTIVLLVFSLSLICGFLRTAYLEGKKKQTPLTLLKTGKCFFWRMFGGALLFFIPYVLLARFFFFLLKQFVSIETPFFETAKTYPWLYSLCFMLSTLILIKFILFIPSLIIVLNCRLFTSFKLLKFTKLQQAKELILLFLGSYLLGLLEVSFWGYYSTWASPYCVLKLVFAVIRFLVGFWVSVVAIRFVASLELVYDEGPRNLGFEDLQKYSERNLKE